MYEVPTNFSEFMSHINKYEHIEGNLLYRIRVYPDKKNTSEEIIDEIGKLYEFKLTKLLNKHPSYDYFGYPIFNEDPSYKVNGSIKQHYISDKIFTISIILTLNGETYRFEEYILTIRKNYILFHCSTKNILYSNTLFLEKEIIKEFKKIQKGFLKMVNILKTLN